MSFSDDDSALRHRAKQAVTSSGLTQRQVAVEMSIDETKLSKSLSGRRRLSPAEIIALATATGVTAQWLLSTGDDVSVSPPPHRTPSGTADGPAGDDPYSPLDPQSGERALRRRMIVETAWSLFSRRGFESVRIADIAEALGISSAGIHYYFPSKQDLMDESLHYSVKLAFDRQIAWLSDVPDPLKRLERLLEMQSPIGQSSVAEWSIWLQTWNRLALAGEPDQTYIALYSRWSNTVRTTIEAGQATGAFRNGDSTEMADELTSLLDGLGIKVLTGVLDTATFRARLSAYVSRSIVSP